MISSDTVFTPMAVFGCSDSLNSIDARSGTLCEEYVCQCGQCLICTEKSCACDIREDLNFCK